MTVDLLSIAPHPDDVELHCGGLMLKMAARGHRTGIVDLTRGELGTRGTSQIREQEATNAARLLNVAVRENLNLPDGGLAATEDQKLAVISCLRACRPPLLLIPHAVARHPDHTNASTLVQEAAFLSGLARIDTGQQPFRPRQILFYFTHYTYRGLEPSFLVDISDYMEGKLAAVRAFTTQFHHPASTEPQTYISRPEFLQELEAQNRYFGSLIGVRYAEPFVMREFLTIEDPVVYFEG